MVDTLHSQRPAPQHPIPRDTCLCQHALWLACGLWPDNQPASGRAAGAVAQSGFQRLCRVDASCSRCYARRSLFKRMRAVDLIRKKRDSGELSREEINFLVSGYTSGDIPDYQMAAWLMAVWIRGLNRAELAALTEVMLHSGEVLNHSEIPGKKVDKHSTGGIGDKTSLILAPVVAAGGLTVPMISG